MLITLRWRRARVLWLLAILLVASGMWLAVPAKHVKADDGGYPYATYNGPGSDPSNYVWTDSKGKMYSPYHYAYRNCTDYVAWKLDSANNWNAGVSMGNAIDWKSWTTTDRKSADNNPAVGSIAWWGSHSWNGGYGHVAYVTNVNSDGTVDVSEYNFTTPGSYDTRSNVKADSYLHLNDLSSSPTPTPTPKPTPPPDTDGDGIIDSQDPCPLVYGKPNGCPVKADYNQDGRADITAFYRYDNNVTNLWRWNGGSGQSVSAPVAPWTASGWDASRTIPVGSGDFNGDHVQDFAAFYRQDSGLDLNIWYGDGNGGFTMYHAWHGDSSWEGARIIPAGVGDFNHDGHDDIAAFYRHDNLLVDLRIWYGQSNGYIPEPSGPWSATGWDGARIIPAGVGDFDGNGKPDILTFYRHDNGMMDLNVWYGDNTGNFYLARPWHVDSGWDGSRFIPAGVGDFNGDGKADIAVFYRHDNLLVDLRIWYGTSNGAPVADPTGPWSATGWDGARIMPAGVGDYNGDGHMDIATFYRQDNGMLDMNIWYGDGQGLTLARPWHVDSLWEGERLYPII